MSKRIGKKMAMVLSFVVDNPGLPMRRAAHHVSPSPIPEKCESYGYNTVHRAINSGIVRKVKGPGNCWLLYPVSNSSTTTG